MEALSIPTFVLTIISLIVFFLIMRWLLFKRVGEFMDNRANSIKESLENAEKNLAESNKIKTELEERLKKASEEANAIVAEARAKAEKEYEKILAAAKADSEKLIEETRIKLEQERKQTLAAIKSQVANLVILAASKVIEENMDNKKNKVLVEKVIEEVGA